VQAARLELRPLTTLLTALTLYLAQSPLLVVAVVLEQLPKTVGLAALVVAVQTHTTRLAVQVARVIHQALLQAKEILAVTVVPWPQQVVVVLAQ
jgi:hypothetical protein